MAHDTVHIPMRLDTKAILLRQNLFSKASETLLESFSQAAQVKTLKKGETLFLQDDDADAFYIVLSGWVKLFRETLDGHEAVIDMVTSGHIFAETAILEDGAHSFGASAIDDVRVLRLPNAILKKAITDDNGMALSMLTSLSRHRKRQTREIESLTLQNASQRIGCFLLRLCHQDDIGPIELKLPYDKSLIAARLGMKSETFSRALNKLRDETGITVKGATVIIPTLETMSHFACSACSNEFPCDDMH
ncbi:Crp/Fnr family transcriptional regulator [Kordiimonas aestuarii]|uniref:Crp/Fnr family transcriptional regulator n=1 Tax=Kordiimonas aestuarii TaxID=1005925 RepID=UPI0021D05B3C|nr:Crp/Fnr family transcriptional regulator [Kordiimonas aestuarii]